MPDNIVEATFMREVTVTKPITVLHNPLTTSNETNSTNETSEYEYMKEVIMREEVNYIGLLVFSIVFGCILSSLGDKVSTLKNVIQEINEVIMKLLNTLFWLLILGMFSWMCEEGLKTKSVTQLFQSISLYVLADFVGVLIHQVIILPGLYFLIVRKNPLQFQLDLLSVTLTGFGTASSAPSLPIAIRIMEEKLKTHPAVTRSVLPLGMMVHKNGLSIDLPIKVLFLTQILGLELNFDKLVLMNFVVFLLTIASPTVSIGPYPAFLVTTLSLLGIPTPPSISLIVAFEWMIERVRTTSNIIADCYVAAYVDKLCSSYLTNTESQKINIQDSAA
ncbi:putative sodium-dependent excitatory amino acid transporter glt-3 [Tachypleus tridentatus]|uniref:putative sodium-dependent excitatory amino acid transporter glt-3 n=1 Tax=Tachypleus tridentatus TaxID=6853 RepID=UPI003FD41811